MFTWSIRAAPAQAGHREARPDRGRPNRIVQDLLGMFAFRDGSHVEQRHTTIERCHFNANGDQNPDNDDKLGVNGAKGALADGLETIYARLPSCGR
jgi:hypothetical protein